MAELNEVTHLYLHMFAGYVGPPYTHEYRLLPSLGRASCLTGTVPTCQVVVGVLVI